MSRGLNPLQILLKLTEAERQNAMTALATLAEKKAALEKKISAADACGKQLLKQRHADLKRGVYATKLKSYDLSIDEQKALLEGLDKQIQQLDCEEQQLLTSFIQTDHKKKGLEKVYLKSAKKEAHRAERIIQQGMDDMMARRTSGYQ